MAANLAGVITAHDVELACRLVEAVQAQNTRAGKARTYHLVIAALAFFVRHVGDGKPDPDD